MHAFYNLLYTTFRLRFLSSLAGSNELQTSNQVGCLLCITVCCTAVRKKIGVFVRHEVMYENGSFLIAGQGSVPVRLPEPVVSGLLL